MQALATTRTISGKLRNYVRLVNERGWRARTRQCDKIIPSSAYLDELRTVGCGVPAGGAGRPHAGFVEER